MSFAFHTYPDRLFFVPLGGSNEIGMNLNLYTIGGHWLMVDCGIGFANDYLPGVEVVVPDISFVQAHREKLVGLVITHAHEDHLGAVAYLWRDLQCPIIATPFTAALLKHKFAEMGITKPDLRVVSTSSQMQLGPFDLDLIGITHSIPEMQAVAITTSAGTVMHTGDWKFDANPQIGPASDLAKLKAYGDKGVLAMVCDSTNVFVEGSSGSEAEVREHLTQVIASCSQRVVVTTFASNIARLDTVVKAANATGRVISLAGRSMWRMIETAQESGYISKEQEFVDAKEIMNLPRKDVLILCTGNQGEPRAALTRMARDDHPFIRLSPGDTVVMSSRKIPGNETRINHMVNLFVRKRVEVVTDRNFYIHVSGHPAREELKQIYALVRPAIAVPTHGEAQHLHEHAKFARGLGVKETIEAQNGAVVLLEEGEARVVGHVEHGLIAVDGASLIPVDGHVIRTRRKLRDDGAFFVSLVFGKNGSMLSQITLSTPGILDPEEDGELIAEYKAEITAVLEDLSPKVGQGVIEETVIKTLRRVAKRDLDKRPMVFVHIARV